MLRRLFGMYQRNPDDVMRVYSPEGLVAMFRRLGGLLSVSEDSAAVRDEGLVPQVNRAAEALERSIQGP